jgi:hypothetical protein
MKFLVFLFSSFVFISNINAQELGNKESKEVADLINTMFTAMKTSDTNLLKSCFSKNAVFQTIVTKNGTTEVRNELVQDFINSVGKQPAGSLDERIKINTILIDATLASVWTPYQFYFKGQYSHQGVNSFQLVRHTEGWKIQYLIDTRRK